MAMGYAEAGRTVFPSAVQARIDLTLSCRDSDTIPKVADAGVVVERDGAALQVMHDGTLVHADGYCGAWTTEIIRRLRGHHEPQEELIFHHLLPHVRSGSLIVELGAWWAYYTNWYLGAVPGAEAVCVEPDPANLELGRANLALNGRAAEFINAALGGEYQPRLEFGRAVHGGTVTIESLDMPALAGRLRGRSVEMLHMDMQGAELAFLRSLPRAGTPVRFVIVSTHHESISGSATTHADCLAELRGQGAAILAEHDVMESYSGDGLIAASFCRDDASLSLPPLSRLRGSNPLWQPRRRGAAGWLDRAVAACGRLVGRPAA
jgi:FkbM family methyltransferase